MDFFLSIDRFYIDPIFTTGNFVEFGCVFMEILANLNSLSGMWYTTSDKRDIFREVTQGMGCISVYPFLESYRFLGYGM